MRRQHETTKQHQRSHHHRQSTSRLTHPTGHNHTSNQHKQSGDQHKHRPASLRQITHINSKHHKPQLRHRHNWGPLSRCQQHPTPKKRSTKANNTQTTNQTTAQPCSCTRPSRSRISVTQCHKMGTRCGKPCHKTAKPSPSRNETKSDEKKPRPLSSRGFYSMRKPEIARAITNC